MANALLKVFPVILLLLVVVFLPKVTCFRLQVDSQKYVGDGLHPAQSKREDEDQDRLFLTTRYGKRARGYLEGKPFDKEESIKWMNSAGGNQVTAKNGFTEVNRAIDQLKMECLYHRIGLLNAIQKEYAVTLIALKNLEGQTKEM